MSENKYRENKRRADSVAGNEANFVTIQDMMACRDRRSDIQSRLLQEYGHPIISFCMNIPGPVKTNALIRRAFDEGCSEIRKAISEAGWPVSSPTEIHEKTGDELILSVDAAAADIKKRMSLIEETHPLGRLFDIDVLDTNGEKLSRPRYRTCFICSRQAQDCARSRRHTAQELFESIMKMLNTYYQSVGLRKNRPDR